jgi:hypothetical protein
MIKQTQGFKKSSLVHKEEVLLDNKQIEEILLKVKGAATANLDLSDLTKKDK